MSPLLVIIFAKNRDDFEKCQKNIFFSKSDTPEIIFCNSKNQDRAFAIFQFPKRWLLFIDADCTLSDATVTYACQFIRGAAGDDFKTVRVGRYLNPSPSSYLQRGHNFIANAWVQSYVYPGSAEIPLLGGIFCLYSEPQKINHLDRTLKSWGAEDKSLGNDLRKCGFSIQFDPRLEVIHATSGKIPHFFRRAFLHGFQDYENSRVHEENKHGRKFIGKTMFWISETARTGLVLIPLILFHFLTLMLGKLTQRILRKNKPVES